MNIKFARNTALTIAILAVVGCGPNLDEVTERNAEWSRGLKGKIALRKRGNEHTGDGLRGTKLGDCWILPHARVCMAGSRGCRARQRVIAHFRNEVPPSNHHQPLSLHLLPCAVRLSPYLTVCAVPRSAFCALPQSAWPSTELIIQGPL